MGIPNYFFKLGGSFSPPAAEDCTCIILSPYSGSAAITLTLTDTAADTLVNWGDGTTEAGAASMTHTYTDIGTSAADYSKQYKLKIYGSHTKVGLGNSSLVYGFERLYSGLTSCDSMFKSCPRLKNVGSVIIPNGCTNIQQMFADCVNMERLTGPVVIPNTVTDATRFIKGCGRLVMEDVELAMSTAVVRSDYLFANNYQMKSLRNFTLANYTIAFHIFDGCRSLVSLPEGFKICSANAENIQDNFSGCTALQADITNIWPSSFTQSKINIGNCFLNCGNITGTAPAELLWNNPNVTWTATGCFSGCTKLTNYNEIPSSWGGGGA